jgi:hypothetical protein
MEKVAGKLYTSSEIDENYGEVKHSHIIETNVLREAVEKCDDLVHFNIHGGNIIIANSCEDIIHPKQFALFSKSVLKEFLAKPDLNEYTELQIRGNDYTTVIKNGKNCVQKSRPCPPFCT